MFKVSVTCERPLRFASIPLHVQDVVVLGKLDLLHGEMDPEAEEAERGSEEKDESEDFGDEGQKRVETELQLGHSLEEPKLAPALDLHPADHSSVFAAYIGCISEISHSSCSYLVLMSEMNESTRETYRRTPTCEKNTDSNPSVTCNKAKKSSLVSLRTFRERRKNPPGPWWSC